MRYFLIQTSSHIAYVNWCLSLCRSAVFQQTSLAICALMHPSFACHFRGSGGEQRLVLSIRSWRPFFTGRITLPSAASQNCSLFCIVRWAIFLVLISRLRVKPSNFKKTASPHVPSPSANVEWKRYEDPSAVWTDRVRGLEWKTCIGKSLVCPLDECLRSVFEADDDELSN